jgi:hypothetical protein
VDAKESAVANFKDFLTHHVEGYLFEDIKSLMAVPVPGGTGPGGVGYPLVMTVLSGIELLGVFVEADKNPTSNFNTHSGPLYFETYWKEILYPRLPDLADPVYQLARHGLMHAFTTKGPIEVSKTPTGRVLHLSMAISGVIHINCDQFAEDFRGSYDSKFKPLVAKNYPRMEARLQDMATQYQNQAKTRLATVNFRAAPTPPTPQGRVVNVSNAVNITPTAVTSSWMK